MENKRKKDAGCDVTTGKGKKLKINKQIKTNDGGHGRNLGEIRLLYMPIVLAQTIKIVLIVFKVKEIK
jgi:hypothetical protein